MYIRAIELKDYRNYSHLKTAFSRKVNFILGNNAEGKTNLIEGIYLASAGRSFRAGKDSDLVKFGRDMAKVKVEAEKNNCFATVEIIINKDSKKSVKKDGSHIKSASELLDNILIVIFSPEDLKIVKDEPERRRRFIDRELCQILPSYCSSLNNYRKALLQRNACLKEGNAKVDVLSIWDAQLAKYGTRIIKEREKFIKKLSGYCGHIHSRITNGKEDLLIEYRPNIRIPENKERCYYDGLKEALPRDMRLGSTSRGPHRDDISFYVGGTDMRSYGSQGQQRTCALSLKLAELSLIKEETGEDAVLLLDDVMSELDAGRREFLIKALKSNQVFITGTGTDEKMFRAFPDKKVFFIESGKIIREE